MSGWSLGIDFGTSYTVAAIATDAGVQTVEGGGRDRMPSAVFLNESGEVLVGAAAQSQAKFAPDRFEPTPKRSLGEGELFLGDRLIAVSELVAAVLAKVYREACQRQGERTPDSVRVTHPADWEDARKSVLLEACARAQIPEPVLVPEPVAAAVRIALQVTPPGKLIAVYDFGGGTFDAAVLLRTDDGFEVAGPPVGRDPLGGEDIDQRIIEHIGSLLAEDHPDEWAQLLKPTDVNWRGAAAELRAEVKQAKETLTDVGSCQIWVPGIKRGVQLTRPELEGMIGDFIDATADALEDALSEARVTAGDLAGLYLVGGSSRIPLVERTLWSRVGIKPSVQDNPKVVVASGAAIWTRHAPAAGTAQPPWSGPVPVPAGGGESALSVAGGPGGPGGDAGGGGSGGVLVGAGVADDSGAAAVSAAAAGAVPGEADTLAQPTAVTEPLRAAQPAPTEPLPLTAARSAPTYHGELFHPRLAFRLAGLEGTTSANAAVQLLVRNALDGATIRVRDTATIGDTAALAAAALAQWRKRSAGFQEQSCTSARVAGVHGGLERRFSLGAGAEPEMLEHYLVLDGRALVITGPESARDLIAGVELVGAPPADGSAFHGRLTLPAPDGWHGAERLTVWARGAVQPLVAEHEELADDGQGDEWVLERVTVVMKQPQAQLASRAPVRMLGEIDGELITVTWRDGRRAMITRIGLAVNDGSAYSLKVSVAHRDPQLFALASRFLLR